MRWFLLQKFSDSESNKTIIGFLFFAVIIFFIVKKIRNYIKEKKEYNTGEYHKITKTSFFTVSHDKGKFGEFLIYDTLKDISEQIDAKFLFNVYLPKKNGKTTEIDVLMITQRGVFVFESKNFSGWIFGNEAQKNWYQTLQSRYGVKKEHFYNPIMQNRTHTEHLKSFLGEHIPLYSVIVFSDRCELMNVTVTSSDVSVIHRHELCDTVMSIFISNLRFLSPDESETIYKKLYPYSQADSYIKTRHIVDIQNSLSKSQNLQDPNSSETQGNPPFPTETTAESTQPQEKEVETQSNPTNIANSEKIKPLIHKCPKCDGDLILRTATRGTNAGKQFYGCSNYPRCKYIEPLKEQTLATNKVPNNQF